MTSKPTFDIRQITPQESASSRIGEYSFNESPVAPRPKEDERWQKYAAGSRIFASFRNDTPLAMVVTHPMTINVRNAIMPMGGIGGVGTLPAGRRQGHIRALLTTAFETMRKDGQAVSALYPFRESFYERMGYTGWTAPLWVTVNPEHLFPIVRLEKPGSVEHLLIADGFDEWVNFLTVYQKGIHGLSLAGMTRLESVRDENKLWLVLVREGDEVTGAMTYRITGHVRSMVISTLYTMTTAAHYQLLDWIGRHADHVKEARIRLPRDAKPELWFRDLKPGVSTLDEEAWDAPMGRIVSIDGLAGIGAGNGEVTIEITDEQCPWNQGTWTLRGANGTLEVTRGGTSTTSATITIQGLSALVFSGTDPETFSYRGWGAVDPETATQLRAIFPPASPYLHELF